MNDRIASVISAIFHPLLIPSALLLLLFYLPTYNALLIPFDAKWLIVFVVFCLTFIFPLVFTLVIKQKGIIKSIHMETREERVFPLIISAILNFTAFYMIRETQIPQMFYIVLLGSTLTILLSLLINFYTKISLHMVGCGGLTGGLIGTSLHLNMEMISLIVAAIFISGVIGAARLKLHAHRSGDVYAGYALGIVVMTIITII